MTTCPVCQTSFNEPITQPVPTSLPSIPLAYDVPSLLEAVKQLTQGYNQLSGKTLGNKHKNNQAPKKSKVQLGRFIELKQGRSTVNLKVYSKDDPTTFVEFNQINAMTFQDTVTGETWTWQR